MADSPPDQPEGASPPTGPVRVILAGGGSHEGLPAGWFLGAGPHAALRYPNGHLELIMDEASTSTAEEEASGGVRGPLVDGLPEPEPEPSAEAEEPSSAASALAKRARNKPASPDQPQPADPDPAVPAIAEPAQSPAQE